MLEAATIALDRIRFRMSASARAGLWKRLSELTRSDVPIATAVQFLSDSKVKGPTSPFLTHQSSALTYLPFADAAMDWVPKLETLMIRLTQEDRIAEGFRQAARIAGVRGKLRSSLASGLTYPIILAFITAIVVAVLPKFALDSMSAVADPSYWPPISRSVLTFAELISNWGFATAAALVLMISALIWAAPRWHGALRRSVDWIPVFRVYRQFAGPEILSAWLSLIGAGTQSQRALTELKAGLPPYLAGHVEEMITGMYRGLEIEDALDTGLFSADSLADLRIFQMTGDFTLYGDEIAEADIQRALHKIERSTKALSTMLLMLVGGIAVWIYIGIARVAMTVQQLATF